MIIAAIAHIEDSSQPCRGFCSPGGGAGTSLNY